MVSIVTSPLIEDSLGHIRDKDISIEEFRHYSKLISILLFAEATKDLDNIDSDVITPLEKTTAKFVKKEIVFIPILRAGLAIHSALQELVPNSKAGFIGLERDEQTAIASQYYFKIPKLENATVFILDPMIATGGSAISCINNLQSRGAEDVRLVSIISAPEGLEAIQSSFPNTQIYTACIDRELNQVKYILPGLGDFGDRYFGT